MNPHDPSHSHSPSPSPTPTSTSTSSSSTASSANPPLPPLRNPKYRHISRSAAKRESVQLLGSIKDLQLHFSRAGLVEHRPGAGVGVKGVGSGLGSLGEDDEDLGVENRPPYTSGPSSSGSGLSHRTEKKERRPWKEVELPRVDAEDARIEAKSIISDVRGIWGLSIPVSPTASTGIPSSKSLYFPINLHESVGEYRNSEDIQSALVTTAQSIRRVRFLALSVSHAASGRKVSGPHLPSRLGGAGKLRSSLSTPSRPSGPPRVVSGGSITERKSSLGRDHGIQQEDILGDLRKAALEVLTALRALEERLRMTLQDDEAQAQASPDHCMSDGRALTPTPSQTATAPSETGESNEPHESGPDSVVFAEPEAFYDSDEDSLFNVNALADSSEKEKAASQITTWEERIVSENREYRVMNDDEWEKEARGTREGVGKWVAVVERLFVFASSGEEGEGEVDDWVRDNGWEGKDLERIHSFLLSHLPIDLALRIPPPSASDFASAFLSSLSDGYILIHAYNSSLLQSSKPWGFIPDSDVHDTLAPATGAGTGDEGSSLPPLAVEEGTKKDKEWTFRRVGNLTCFGAALKHRYQLPIVIPSSTSHTSTSTSVSNSTASSLHPGSASLPGRTSSSSSASPSRSSSPPATVSASSSGTQADTQSRHSRPSITTTISGNGAKEELEFDPMGIAKRSSGCNQMLSRVVLRWVGEVGREIRETRERSAGGAGSVPRSTSAVGAGGGGGRSRGGMI